jgi:cation:H+ antiporter
VTWLAFAASAAVMVVAAIRMVQSADVISVRTGLGGFFIGTILVAMATSLPEIITSVSAVFQDLPNLAAGDPFGSSMFNMFLLAIADFLVPHQRILRRVGTTHALTAALATYLTALAVLFVLVQSPLGIGWVGLDSLFLIGFYVGGVWLIQQRSGHVTPPVEVPEEIPIPSMRRASVEFLLGAVVMMVASRYLVSSAAEIAAVTGLGTGFVGTTLFAFVTSLPELVSMYAAIQLNAFDMAVGNLFGSNAFNMVALGITDLFYVDGHLFSAIDTNFAIAGLIALILINMALLGNLARVERRLLFIEIDAALIVAIFLAGLAILYQRGIGL